MPDFDLDYAPMTYWPGPWTTDLVTTKGSFMRWATEGFAPSSAPLLGGSPASLFAGEYLPDLEPEEVEIARVELDSTLGDVYSVRARRHVAGLLHYRVVSEYDEEFEVDPPTSESPISMGQLVGLIASVERDDDMYGSGLTNAFRNMNLETDPDAERLLDFVRVTSSFYPELERYYADEAEQWLNEIERGGFLQELED